MDNNIDKPRKYAQEPSSGLAMQTDNKNLSSRDKEVSGEAESLYGIINPYEMGSKVVYEKPKKDEEGCKHKDIGTNFGSFKMNDNLEAEMEAEYGDEYVYRPKTKETRGVYENILSNLSTSYFNDMSPIELRISVNELLSIMKDDKINDKKNSIHETFGISISDEMLYKITNFSKQLNDYKNRNQEEQNEDYENIGLSVTLDETEDITEDDSDGIESPISVEVDNELFNGTLEYGNKKPDENDNMYSVDERCVDSHWIQRKLSKYYHEPQQCLFLANNILSILSSRNDPSSGTTKDNIAIERRMEGEISSLLGLDKFNLVKLFVKNRTKILISTLIAKSGIPIYEDESIRNLLKENNISIDEGNVLEVLSNLKKPMEENEDSGLGVDYRKYDTHNEIACVENKEDFTGRKLRFLYSNFIGGEGDIDIGNIGFCGGDGYVMTNKQCKLPPNSWKKTHNGYEEIHVPSVKTPGIDPTEKLININEDLPWWCVSAFKNVRCLNRIQSKVCPKALYSDENLLVCAPTGSGKTNIALLSILRILYINKLKNIDSRIKSEVASINDHNVEVNINDIDTVNELVRFSDNEGSFKIIYIAPMKALVQEMVTSFSERLKPYNIRVEELTGDKHLSYKQFSDVQLIVATPEKWDIMTRKSMERGYKNMVQLIIIDEIHLLHDYRGSVLESIISRFVWANAVNHENKLRIVGLSATLPNYDDVAKFLRVRSGKDGGMFYFDSSYRPCPLSQTFYGFKEKKPFKRLQLMNKVIYERVLERLSMEDFNQIIIFVHSRKDTFVTGKLIRDTAVENNNMSMLLSNRTNLMKVLDEFDVENESVSELLPYGIGIHHAGLSKNDRSLVEDLFLKGYIKLLVSTSTLAWGVNLPAHTVIIKGTKIYSPERGDWVELSPQDILQMFGRAGRPQYDSFGEGILLTNHENLQYYLSLTNMQLPIESQLLSNGRLLEHLNAEVVLGSIGNIFDAVDWLAYTYLFVRLLKDPIIYGIKPQKPSTREEDFLSILDETLLPYDDNYFSKFENEFECNSKDFKEDKFLYVTRFQIIYHYITLLEKYSLLKFSRSNGVITPTEFGRITSYYYLNCTSLSIYNHFLRNDSTDIEIFKAFSLSREFSMIPVRPEEKLELNKLLGLSPIPIKETLGESINIKVNCPFDRISNFGENASKINILLQAYISGLSLKGSSLASDLIFISSTAVRIFKALFEFALHKDLPLLSRKLLSFSAVVSSRTWITLCPLRQFRNSILKTNVRQYSKISKIFPEFFDCINRLERKGFSYNYLCQLNPIELKGLFSLPSGKKDHIDFVMLHKLIHSFPRFEIFSNILPISRSFLRLSLSLLSNFIFDDPIFLLLSSNQSIHLNTKDYASHEDGITLWFWLFVEDVDEEKLLYKEKFGFYFDHSMSPKVVNNSGEDINLYGPSFSIDIIIPIYEPISPVIYVHFISENFLPSASATKLPISLKNIILPSKNQPPDSILDIFPLQLTKDLLGLRNNEFHQQWNILTSSIWKDIKTLNCYQTQIIKRIFKTFNESKEDNSYENENLFIGAPPSTGKSTIAELLVVDSLKDYVIGENDKTESIRIIFINPIEELIQSDVIKYREVFCNPLFSPKRVLKIGVFVGEYSVDMATFEKSHIVFSNPKNFDSILRKWDSNLDYKGKLGRLIYSVNSIILDNFHVFNHPVSSPIDGIKNENHFICDYETLITRLRLIQTIKYQEFKEESSCNKSLRMFKIICLSLSISPHRDVREWLGVKKDRFFNFLMEFSSFNNSSVMVKSIPSKLNDGIVSSTWVSQSSLKTSNSSFSYLSKYIFDSLKVLVLDKNSEGNKTNAIIFTPSYDTSLEIINGIIELMERRRVSSIVSPRSKGAILEVRHKFHPVIYHYLSKGILLLSDNITREGTELALELFRMKVVAVMVITKNLMWKLSSIYCEFVIIVSSFRFSVRNYSSFITGGNENYNEDNSSNVHPGDLCNYIIEDSLSEIFFMIGRSRVLKEKGDIGHKACVDFYVFKNKMEYFRKYISEPLKIESQLNPLLSSNELLSMVSKYILNEIGSFKFLNTFQDIMYWFSSTFFYRRMLNNPNFYMLSGIDQITISNYLSEIIESNLNMFSEHNIISFVENKDSKKDQECDFVALNLSLISSYYNLSPSSVEFISTTIKSSTKIKGILEMLSIVISIELISLPVRGQSEIENICEDSRNLQYIYERLPLKFTLLKEYKNKGVDFRFINLEVKVFIIIQSFMERYFPYLGLDKYHKDSYNMFRYTNFYEEIVRKLILMTPNVLLAIVDISSSLGYLNTCLSSIDLLQMLSNACSIRDSVMKSIPFLDEEKVNKLQKKYDTFFDIVSNFSVDEKEGRLIFPIIEEIKDGLNDFQIDFIKAYLLRFPNLEISYEIIDEEDKCIFKYSEEEQINSYPNIKMDVNTEYFKIKVILRRSFLSSFNILPWGEMSIYASMFTKRNRKDILSRNYYIDPLPLVHYPSFDGVDQKDVKSYMENAVLKSENNFCIISNQKDNSVWCLKKFGTLWRPFSEGDDDLVGLNEIYLVNESILEVDLKSELEIYETEKGCILNLKIDVISDSWMSSDQEFKLNLSIV